MNLVWSQQPSTVVFMAKIRFLMFMLVGAWPPNSDTSPFQGAHDNGVYQALVRLADDNSFLHN